MLHLSSMSMNLPPSEHLLNLLKEIFTKKEAEITLSIPSKRIPFEGITAEEISKSTNMNLDKVEKMLLNLTKRGLIFSQSDKTNGMTKYSLQQAGYGFPQVFFCKGEDTPHARKMAKLILKYFNKQITKETFCTDPIPYRFVPVDQTIDIEKQSIYPFHVMEKIIQNAETIAVAHCMCRQEMKLLGRDCGHPTEVCMKFDDLARYMIDKGFAREINVKEALEISKKASEAGLVHFTDNAMENVQQNCNCCGCSCWNLGRIRRRHIPRDTIIATYFIRETIIDNCIGCGNCIDVCPVMAVKLEYDLAIVDKDWCIGCGLCEPRCPNDAIKIIPRKDLKNIFPEKNFKILHEKILDARQ